MNIVQFALMLYSFFRLLEVIAGKFCRDNDRSSQALYSQSVKILLKLYKTPRKCLEM